MKTYQRQTFDLDNVKLGPGVYADYEFDRCTFSWAPFAYPHHPQDRAIVRNCKLVNCEVQAPLVDGFVAEGCLVENLRARGELWISGAIFKHVVLRGRLGSLMFTEHSPGGEDRLRKKATFARADEAYYEHVDWALDIREAEFYACEFRYMPGHLVRRDPETQGLIWRDKLLRHDWKSPKFPFSGSVFFDLFLESGLPSMVVVACKRHPTFERQMEELKELRRLGIAEPD